MKANVAEAFNDNHRCLKPSIATAHPRRVLIIAAAAMAALGAFASTAAAQPAKEWIESYMGPAGFRDLIWDLVVDNAGNVYLTGESDHGTGSSYATVKYDSNGNQLWVARYDGPAHGSDKSFSIKLDGDNNVIVTGVSDGIGVFGDYATVKYDGVTGDQLWATRYNGPGNNLDGALSVALDSAGNAYVTGQSWGGDATFYDLATVKYDGQTGQELWVRRYDGPFSSDIGEHEHAQDAGIAIAVDSQGGPAVCGWAQVGYNQGDEFNIYNYITVKYDTNGNLIWDEIYGESNDFGSQGVAVAIDSNDDVIVTGNSEGAVATVKYAGPSGNVLWTHRYNGPANSSTAYALTLDAAGNPVVAGSTCASSPFCNESFLALRIDNAAGTLDWDGVYTAPSAIGSSGRGVAADASGNVYVTGFTQFSSQSFAVTVKFDAAGNTVWVDSYDSPENRSAVGKALGIGPQGSLYMGGQVRRLASFWDYLTIKFESEVVCDPCDANCDGSVNLFDIEPFVDALSPSPSLCSPCAGDANSDGSINLFDIEPFVDCLTG